MKVTYGQDMCGLRIRRKLGIITPRYDVLAERPKEEKVVKC